jgi:predicted dinucleotide-binding enzyme
VYYPDARVAAEQYADQLAGKVVVDITNPVNETFDGLVVRPTAPPPLSWRRWPAERGS